MNFKRGKKPARPDAVKLRFGAYFHEAALPAVPERFGRPWLVQQWRMLGNDTTSDCVQAGAAHETMYWTAEGNRSVPLFTPSVVLKDYRAVNPDDTDFTGGTDVAAYAAYRQRTGILDSSGVRHRIDVYTALRAGDIGQLALSAFLFGAVGVGVALPASAENQFDRGEVWTPVRGERGGDGHYIVCVGRNSQGNFLFVSWGRLTAATPEWIEEYMDEGLAYFSRERLNEKGLSPQGYNAAQLADDLDAVTA